MDGELTTVATILAVATACFALTDWWGVWTGSRAVRLVAKPATLAALIGVALSLEPFDSGVRSWLVAGLALSLVGDVALLFEERLFVVGLAAFLAGHIAYIVAMQLDDRSLPWLYGGVAVVAVCAALVGRRIVAAVRAGGHRSLVGPVVAYVVAISAMVVSAFGTASPVAVAGALAFYASDATLAWNRFVAKLRFGPLAVMVTYHLGQAGLVAWLVTS